MFILFLMAFKLFKAATEAELVEEPACMFCLEFVSTPPWLELMVAAAASILKMDSESMLEFV